MLLPILLALPAPSPTTPAEADYLANPTNIDDASLPVGWFWNKGAGVKDACIIFHGAGGPDRETADLETRVRAIDEAAGLDRLVAVYDWTQWLGTEKTAAFDGQAIGRKLGAALRRQEERELLAWQGQGLRSLHVIGTSVGAFAADAFVTSYVTASMERDQWVPDPMKGARARVRLTLCDPFTARPSERLYKGWGVDNFGLYADFAEHIMNTDDPVPSTNVPTKGCYVLDVTKAEARKEFKPPNTGNFFNDLGSRFLLGHNWPMGWYARTLEVELDTNGRVLIPSHQDLPRGEVLMID